MTNEIIQNKVKEIKLKEETVNFKNMAIIKLLIEENIVVTDVTEAVFDELLYDADVRVCGACKSLMKDGYCIEGGFDYRCSDECLFTDITEQEWIDMSADDCDSYYTEWECKREMYKDINLVVCKYPELGYKVDAGYFPELIKR